jgi:transaldolase
MTYADERLYVEVRAHADLNLWPNVEDPATQHTMSARMVQILETYKRLYKETGKEQPMVKSARYICSSSSNICRETDLV